MDYFYIILRKKIIMNVLKLIKFLERNGFTPTQAEAIVESFMEMIQNNDLVTKDFLKAELNGLELKMDAKISHLEVNMLKMKWDLIKWMISVQLVTVSLILSLIFFLHRN